MTLAQKFMALFAGRDNVRGTFTTNSPGAKGEKVGGKAYTITRPITETTWENHLNGVESLGLIPIRDDNTCFFGAVDIDVYTLDHAALCKKVADKQLPVIVCTSKSGGAHVYLFSCEPIPAYLLVPKLREVERALGYSGLEIFPKQLKLEVAEGAKGSWINMPYFGGDNSARVALDNQGNKLTADQFVEVAYNMRITRAGLSKLVPLEDALSSAPPCLQSLCTSKFKSGMRNDGLMALSVFLKKANPDGWKEEMYAYNDQYFHPPLSRTEVGALISSMEKKDYNYPCKRSPIKEVCNVAVCRTRKYGVGKTDEPTVIISSLTKYTSVPPVWFAEIVGGGRIELPTDALQNQRLFQKRCIEVMNIAPPQVPQKTWVLAINKLLSEIQVVEAPEEATPVGQLLDMLEKFCTGKVQGKSMEDILLGKPFTAREVHIFRLPDFKAFLKRNNSSPLEDAKISVALQEKGAKSRTERVKGKYIRCMTFPRFSEQTEPLQEITYENSDEIF